MKVSSILRSFALFLFFLTAGKVQAQERKAPAYPLITHNTYFSIWSTTDQLNASATQHWTGAEQSLLGLIKVDDKVYRFLGKEETNYRTVLNASDEEAYAVKYAETQPLGNWMAKDFDDAGWKTGQAPIGDNEKKVKTLWQSDDIWVRRAFAINNPERIRQLFLKLNHDDNIEVFLNGKEIYRKEGWTNRFDYIPLNKSDLQTGNNIIAIHLANSAGGRYLDFGLADKLEASSAAIAAAEQKNVEITATQTIYNLGCGGVDMTLTFTSPLLLKDLKLLSRPVSYITYAVQANDGKEHAVQVFLGASSSIAVYEPTQEVVATQYKSGNLAVLKTGTVEQPVLQKGADDMRIDWGYFYVAAPASSGAVQFITKGSEAAAAFQTGSKGATDLKGKMLSLNTVIPFGTVGKSPVKRFVELGYDEIYSVQYFNNNLRPWWNDSGKETIEGQLAGAATEYESVIKKCSALDKEIYEAALKAGGAA
ncbi:MAG: DUF5127 domain-containing protein, partial [Flavihumibacter sp.]